MVDVGARGGRREGGEDIHGDGWAGQDQGCELEQVEPGWYELHGN